MKNPSLHLLLIFILPCFLYSQTMESGDITTKITGIINSLPAAGGDDYVAPAMMELASWEAMLAELLAGDYSDAATSATALGYDLIEFEDNTTSETYYVLQTTLGGTNYWGTYVYNPNACRAELIVMSPHPKKDFNTGKQGIYCYQLTDAYFYMLAGTDRCNSLDFSTCSGSTKVCTGASEDYRVTDMAHVTEAIWQKTTAFLHDNISGTYFVQLHGFGKQATDPYVIMSNGTRNTPMTDKIAALRDELLIADPSLTFKIGHIDLAWDRLLGFTNTNGRYINSSANVCNSSAINTNGRFLHIEQEKFKLRNDIGGWHTMAVALSEAFPGNSCASVAPLPVDLVYFNVQLIEEKVLIQWQTLSEINHAYFELQRSADGHVFQSIAQVAGTGNYFNPRDYQWQDTPIRGANFYRLKQVDYDGQYVLSPVEHIVYKGSNNWSVNWSDNLLRIDFVDKTAGSMKTYNALGQEVFIQTFNSTSLEWATDLLSSGIYFIELRTDNNRQIWRVRK